MVGRTGGSCEDSFGGRDAADRCASSSLGWTGVGGATGEGGGKAAGRTPRIRSKRISEEGGESVRECSKLDACSPSDLL